MLRIIGVVVFALAISAALAIGAGHLAEKRAREFSERTVREIFSDWNYEAIRRNAMKQLRQSPRANAEGPKFLQWGKDGLGPLQEVGEPLGGIAIGWGKGAQPRGLFGNYVYHARFRNGEANLEIGVVWEEWQWRISDYRFDSPVLHDRVQELFSPQSKRPAS